MDAEKGETNHFVGGVSLFRAFPGIFLFRDFPKKFEFLSCVVLVLPVGGDRHTVIASLQLSATDVSARTTMKGAAKCDKHCELQNSVNQ